MRHNGPVPASDLREAIIVVVHATQDVATDPVDVSSAISLIREAADCNQSPVSDWVRDFLVMLERGPDPSSVVEAALALAGHYKIAPLAPTPAPGEQGRLFR